MKLRVGHIVWPVYYSHRFHHLVPLPLTRIGIILNTDPVKLQNYYYRHKIGPKAKIKVVSKQYYQKLGKHPNLSEPISFTEKLNYLKLFYADKRIPRCCDKYQLKQYIIEKIGEGYSAKTYFSSNSFTEEDFELLPNSFVLKVNWSSGYNIMVHDKRRLSKRERRLIVAQLQEWIKPYSNSYYFSFYLGYKNVKPVIFAEEMLPESFLYQEYKVFCFDGKPEFILIEIAPNTQNHKRACIDLSGKILPFCFGTEPVSEKYIIPNNFSEMMQITAELAEGFPFVRVDFLTDEKRLVIGEMTFYSGGGYSIIRPEEWDLRLGSLIRLERSNRDNEKES